MVIIESVSGHFRMAIRSLFRRPGFSLVALLTLGLGIGANTAIFSIINIVLLKPLPFKDPGNLVSVWSTAPSQGLVEGFASYPDFHDWREEARGFDGMAAVWTFPNGDVNLTGGTEPQRVSVARITPGFFEVLGVVPLHGRTFQQEESILGNHRRAILSYGLWRSQFAGDPSLIGRDVMVNGVAYTVVGVMPQELQSRSVHILGTDVQLWRPLVPEDNQTGGRGARKLRVVGRLATSTTLEHAEAELSAVATRLSQTYPETNRDAGIRVAPLREQVVRDVKGALFFLLAAVGVVLIVACANVANLLLIKTSANRKQVAVQRALGASRLRLSAQVLAESLLLGLSGALVGVLLAFGIVKSAVALGPADIPLLTAARIDGKVLAFTLVATLITVLLVGVGPALRSSRTEVMTLLRQGGSRSRGSDDRRVMSGLTVSQIALAMVLLTAGGLVLRSFQNLLRVDPGLDADRVLTFQLELPMAATARYPAQSARDVFFSGLLERLERLPGVAAATMASAPPLEEEPSVFSFTRPGAENNQEQRANFRLVAPEYFRLLAIPIIAGRPIEETDSRQSPRVVVVSNALARSVWGTESPIGQRIDLSFGSSAEVVGVAGDVRTTGLDGEAARTVYVPSAQQGYNFMTVIVKSRNDTRTITPAIRQVVREMDSEVPVHHVRTLDDLVNRSIAQQRLQALLIGAFSLLVFILAVVGTYGVASYSVSQRTNELGIRMAFGATGRDLRRLVLRDGSRLIVLGIVLGGTVAVVLSRTLSRFVFQISTLDPLTFTLAPMLLAVAALVATLLPAFRASRVDPMRVIRSDV